MKRIPGMTVGSLISPKKTSTTYYLLASPPNEDRTNRRLTHQINENMMYLILDSHFVHGVRYLKVLGTDGNVGWTSCELFCNKIKLHSLT